MVKTDHNRRSLGDQPFPEWGGMSFETKLVHGGAGFGQLWLGFGWGGGLGFLVVEAEAE